MGHFGGDYTTAFGSRKIIQVDIDNFDKILAKIAPAVQLDIGSHVNQRIELVFKQLDDFHPDNLIGRLEQYRVLEQSQQDQNHRLPKAVSSQNLTPEKSAETNEKTLERLLGKPREASGSNQESTKQGIDQFIRTIVDPHIDKVSESDKLPGQGSSNADMSTVMREILHAAEFQTIESIWRSVHQLVSNLETDEELELYLLNVTKQELIEDLKQADNDPFNTQLFKLLNDEYTDINSTGFWDLVSGDYMFGAGEDDLNLLGAIGTISAKLRGPFIASASPQLLGCKSMNQLAELKEGLTIENEEDERRWQAFRSSPVATWIGLALPRLLLRLPYGPHRNEIDSFDFDEMPDPNGSSEGFLWGNPAFACAMLLARSFLENRESMQPGDQLILEDLPGFVYESDGEKMLMSCTESWFSERTGELILDRGIMPFLGSRHRNAVRLLQFRSIASPATALSGFWT
jgi:type VI secretion system protein ImpC